jgi:HAE1 family hydrophobic/amphiphilic exporter-1
MLAIIAAGMLGYRLLPVSDHRPSTSNHLGAASLPAPAPRPWLLVATPLGGPTIAGIDNMTSSSSLGSTQITIQFGLDRDIDAAAQDIQAAIAAVTRRLPRDMPSPPAYQKVNPAASPILFIALTSPTLPLFQLHEYAENIMAQRISMVSGVAQVQVFGAQSTRFAYSQPARPSVAGDRD